MTDINRTTVARDLPWPYNGIVRDLTVAVENGCNYLAALGLVCWSEFIGRQIAMARGEDPGTSFDCFTRFVRERMRYDLLGMDGSIYDAFRNGLVHEFGIKGRDSTVATRLYTLDGSRWPGLAFDPKTGQRVLFVEEFLRDFEDALRCWLADTGQVR